jgi:hypothetical protein
VGAAGGKVAKIAKMAKAANTVARNGWRHAPTGPMILQTAVARETHQLRAARLPAYRFRSQTASRTAIKLAKIVA